jgi:hypothetical protein
MNIVQCMTYFGTTPMVTNKFFLVLLPIIEFFIDRTARNLSAAAGAFNCCNISSGRIC